PAALPAGADRAGAGTPLPLLRSPRPPRLRSDLDAGRVEAVLRWHLHVGRGGGRARPGPRVSPWRDARGATRGGLPRRYGPMRLGTLDSGLPRDQPERLSRGDPDHDRAREEERRAVRGDALRGAGRYGLQAERGDHRVLSAGRDHLVRRVGAALDWQGPG